MKIDIAKIAKLSKLKIEQDDIKDFEQRLESMIHMVENLPDINTDISLVDPEDPMTMREDIEFVEFRRDELLKNAPQVQAGCVVVPKVID